MKNRNTEYTETIHVPVYTIMCHHKNGDITFYDDWCGFPNYGNPIRDPNLENGFVLPIGCWGKKSEDIVKQVVVRKRTFDIPKSIVERFDDYCYEQCG